MRFEGRSQTYPKPPPHSAPQEGLGYYRNTALVGGLDDLKVWREGGGLQGGKERQSRGGSRARALKATVPHQSLLVTSTCQMALLVSVPDSEA